MENTGGIDMSTNGLFTKVVGKMVEEFGAETAYQKLFKINNDLKSLKLKKTLYDKDLYDFWYKSLPTGFKLPRPRKGFESYFYENLPSSQQYLMDYINYPDLKRNVFYEYLLKTKAQRMALIKPWFNQTNAIGQRVHEFTVDENYEWDVIEVDCYVALTKDGLFYLNRNRLIGWDSVDREFINALYNNTEMEEVKKDFFERL